VNDLVPRYIDLWNEPDPARRRTAVEALWHPDGGNYTAAITAEGLDAIERRVTASYERWVAPGYRFQQHGPAETHHDVVRVRWIMVPVAGGPPEAAGCELLRLDDRGRILTDHQFSEPIQPTA
jgi:hypothetical protein